MTCNDYVMHVITCNNILGVSLMVKFRVWYRARAPDLSSRRPARGPSRAA